MFTTSQLETLAAQIAARLGDDGQNFEAEDGRRLDDIARAAGANEEREAEFIRYTFRDGSAITVQAGVAWDLGYADCYCWQGAGHSSECEARRSEV